MNNRIYDNGKLLFDELVTFTPEKAFYSREGKATFKLKAPNLASEIPEAMALTVFREIDKKAKQGEMGKGKDGHLLIYRVAYGIKYSGIYRTWGNVKFIYFLFHYKSQLFFCSSRNAKTVSV